MTLSRLYLYSGSAIIKTKDAYDRWNPYECTMMISLSPKKLHTVYMINGYGIVAR
jgi:hypothetical protein